MACFPRPTTLHVFTSNTSLVRPDVFLRLPPEVNFMPSETRTDRQDFETRTAASAMEALTAARDATLKLHPTFRDAIKKESDIADIHFALFCAPYYGYIPGSEPDFLAMASLSIGY